MNMYAKLLVEKTHFFCLQTNWNGFMTLKNSETPLEGWLLFERTNQKPELKEGEVIGYECTVEDGKLKRAYVAVDENESKRGKWQLPRTFSKLKAVSVLTKMGYWQNCKKFIEDAGLYDLYLAAQDFKEDNEYFVQGLERIKSELGLTDEQIEEILISITITTA